VIGISAALPAYNEEENVAPMIEALDSVLSSVTDDYEIVIVDDGSKDRTSERVLEMKERYPNVRLVQHPVNQGFGAAVHTAFTSAAKEWVFYTDSDRQFRVEEISKLLPLAGEADIVAGYRAPRADPWPRKVFGFGWFALCTLLFGYTTRDIDCAFKLFRREIMDRIQVDSRGATFSIEFLARSKRAGYKIAEVPVSHLPRPAGSPTGARISVITRAFRELVRFRLKLWREGRA
jgi:glycosyltransferase involved in cell wall biosynthesis